MTTTFPKITEKGLAELRQALGAEHPVVQQFNEYASKDTIRHWVYGTGDTNPLFTDEEHARQTKWGCIIAPPTFLFSTFGPVPRMGLPGVHGMWSKTEFECFLPIRQDDRIMTSVALTNLIEKSSTFSKRSLHQGWTYTSRNQDGQIIAKVRYWVVRTERDTARDVGKYSYLSAAHYTPEEIKKIEADCDKEEIRGATPRYWEDVQVGQELGTIVKGPLTVTDNIAFKIGWGFHPFALPHRIGLDYRRRHPAAVSTNEFGAPDVPERVHWENEFARRVGVPAAYDFGPQRAAWLCQVLTNWMGNDGFIKYYRCEARRFNLVGDTTWCRGTVTRKYEEGGERLVECDLRAVDQRGETTMPGSAIVSLPSRT